jgi:hypothetical protein
MVESSEGEASSRTPAAEVGRTSDAERAAERERGRQRYLAEAYRALVKAVRGCQQEPTTETAMAQGLRGCDVTEPLRLVFSYKCACAGHPCIDCLETKQAVEEVLAEHDVQARPRAAPPPPPPRFTLPAPPPPAHVAPQVLCAHHRQLQLNRD